MAFPQHNRTVSESSFGDFTTAPAADGDAAASAAETGIPPIIEPPVDEEPSTSGFSDFVAAPAPANDQYWGFFQTALPAPPAPPSPPIRDLRPVEARLRWQERNGTLAPPSEENPFGSVLSDDQLANNVHAQASRLPPPPLVPPPSEPEPPPPQPPQPAESEQPSEPGWSGNLWRTFGSLNLRQIGGQARGAAGEALSHLPRPRLPSGLFDLAADDPEFRAYQQTLPSSGPPSKGPSPAPSPKPIHRSTLSSSVPKAVPIISGAPGFSVEQERFDSQNWNRGGWIFPSKATSTLVPVSAASNFLPGNLASGTKSEPPESAEPLERVCVLTGATPQVASESRFAHRRAQQVKLHGRYADTRQVVRSLLAGQLQAVLPAKLQLGRGWRLVYSTDQHGISLQTLYDRVGRSMTQSSSMRSAAREGWLRGASSATASALAADEPSSSGLSTSATLGQATQAAAHAADKMSRSGLAMHDAGLILAVQDADGNVFGSFLNEAIKPQAHYFGSGQSFLWKTVKVPHRTSDQVGLVESNRMLKIFPWSGRNMYACLAQSNMLAFGGGPDGRYGLWLDDELENGISDVSVTFDNDPLADSQAFPAANGAERKETKFECLALEVWAVGVD